MKIFLTQMIKMIYTKHACIFTRFFGMNVQKEFMYQNKEKRTIS